MTLQEAVKTARETNKTENTSGKNPAYYAKQKQEFIEEVCQSPVTEVRIHAASSEFTPLGNLKAMLVVEQDKDVLSILMQNDRIPIKSLEAFLETPGAEQFNSEDEAYQHVFDRLSSADPDEDGEGDTD